MATRIHENAVNEQMKNMHIKLKSNNVIVEEDLKQCYYCHKVFVNATFVMKHIGKRHAELFKRHQKKYLNPGKTEADLDSQSVLLNLLKNEFSNLKTELGIVKTAVTHHTYLSDQIKSQVTYPTDFQEYKGPSEVMNINIPKDKLSSSNSEVEKATREDLIKFQEQIDELSRMYKDVVSSSKGKEDSVCKRLKKEFEELLVRYQDQNYEWKEQVLHMRNDLRRLEQTVELNTKKIESPEVLEKIESMMEQRMEIFYANYGTVHGRSKTPSKTIKKVLNDNSSNVHRSNRRKKSIFSQSSHDLNLQKRHLGTSVKVDVPHLQAGLSETHNAHTSSILKGNSKQRLGAKRAKILFDEKLKHLSISSRVKEMSTGEYETKMHLVNAQKEVLRQKYTNFQQVYDRLDSHANKLAKSQMERKRQKQLRFSDSISSQACKMKDKMNGEHTSGAPGLPVEEIKSDFRLQSEFTWLSFSHYGDVSDIQDDYSSACVENLDQGDCGLGGANEENGGFKFPEKIGASPPNLLPSNELSELKLIDNPKKRLTLKSNSFTSVDEVSELSSLETDSNVSE